MKPFLHLVLVMFLLFPVSQKMVNRAAAQGWQWGKWNTGAGMDAWPVATDNMGNIFAGGFAWGSTSAAVFGGVSFPANPQTASIVVKYSPAGVPLWVKGNQVGDAYILNIATDGAGNVIMFGAFDSPTAVFDGVTLTNATSGEFQYFIVKYDPLGNVLWARNDGRVDFFASATFLSSCAISWMLGAGSVATDATGNVYVTSSYKPATITIGSNTLTNADPTGATDDIFIAKYSPTGTLLWAKSYGGTGDDEAYGITVTPAGDVYNTGSFLSPTITFGPSTISGSPVYKNVFIARYDATGAATWAISAGGDGCTFGAGMVSDALNNVYVTGGFATASISFGSTTLSKTYPANPNLALYLIQLSPANTVTWSKTIGAPSSPLYGFCIALAACGEVWVSGSFTDSGNVEGHIFRPPANSSDPVFLAGYNLSGGVVGYGTLQSGGDDQNGIACDAAGNVYICSDAQAGVLPLVFGPDTLFSNSTTGSEFFYLAKYQNSVAPADTIYKHTDTTICAGDSMHLVAPTGYIFHHWSNGGVDSFINITSPGIYWVFCVGSCSQPFIIDTFKVTVGSPDTVYRHVSDTLCASGSLTLVAPAGYPTYLWSDNSTGSTLSVNAVGTYYVMCKGPCSMPVIFDTFHVVFNPLNLSFSLGRDTLACQPVTLHIPASNVGYLWSDGSTLQEFTANHTGTYVATVSDKGCYASDTINVTILDLRQDLRDTTICIDSVFHVGLTANVPAGASVVWSTGSHDNSILVSEPGVYWVRVTDSVCSGYDSMQVFSQYCNCSVEIPNAFTPNLDGLNDVFRPIIDPNCKPGGYDFSIYNRWGERVYHSTERSGVWDGQYKGVNAEMGVYMYTLSFSGGIPIRHFFLKGDVTLVR